MCINYDAHEIKTYAEYFGVGSEGLNESIPESYVVRPTNEAPIVWYDEETGIRRMDPFEFSLVPSYTDDLEKAQKNRYKFFNARDDRLLKSPLWKSRFKSKRCLIPANGFFEPHQYSQKIDLSGGKKPTDSIPFYFRIRSGECFAFAGVYDTWQNPDSWQTIRSFTIITTDPNNQIEKIHNKNPRQPVILAQEDYDFWLDPEANPNDYFNENIFRPWPDEDMEHWQVTKEIDYRGQGTHIIEPVDDPIDIDVRAGEQKGLF